MPAEIRRRSPALMVLCVATFLAQLLSRPGGGTPGDFGLFNQFVLDPTGRRWWTLLTSIFMHADLLHLAGNMLFLWVFGPTVEDKFGRVWYTLFYLTAGLASGGSHLLFSDAPALGASGAIAGVTGAFLVLFPWTHIRVLSFFFIIGSGRSRREVADRAGDARDFIGLGQTPGSPYRAPGRVRFGIVLSMVLLADGASHESRTTCSPSPVSQTPRDQCERHTESMRSGSPTPSPRESVLPRRSLSARPSSHRRSAPARSASPSVWQPRMGRAARAYRRLVEVSGRAGAILLGRGQQLAIAHALFAAGDTRPRRGPMTRSSTPTAMIRGNSVR